MQKVLLVEDDSSCSFPSGVLLEGIFFIERRLGVLKYEVICYFKGFSRHLVLIALLPLICILCLYIRIQSFAATLPPIPSELDGYDYVIQLNANGFTYSLLAFKPASYDRVYLSSGPDYSWAPDYTWFYSDATIVYKYEFSANSGGWIDATKSLPSAYKHYFYGSGKFIVANSVPVYSDSTGSSVLYPVNPYTNVRFGADYDSSIPAPQNLTFTYDKTGGAFGIGSKTYHKLAWSNKLVDDYSVRVSARGQYTDSSDNGLTKKDFEVMVVSDGSDGADVGAPASSGFVQFNLAEIMQKLENSSEFGIDSCRPTQYRVQFYKYVDGVLQVGPVGVVNLSVNVFGVWTGTVSTTEVPIDKNNIGQSGGFMGSDAVDGWTSDGQDYQEYDSTGTQTGTGIVGNPDSYVPSGSSGGGGSGGIFQELIQGLLNIPNIVSQLFSSLKNAMSGIGELPAFVSQIVSWLPSEIISLISLGIVIVIVLRIFGR